MKQKLSKAIKYWAYVAPLVKFPKNKKEFDELIQQLDELLTIVGSNEKHPLMSLVDVLSHVIAVYEAEHFALNHGCGINALKFLMIEHGLNQADLAEIGSQGVVSEVLSGKRKLNVRQIKLLASRFKLNPKVFMDD